MTISKCHLFVVRYVHLLNLLPILNFLIILWFPNL